MRPGRSANDGNSELGRTGCVVAFLLPSRWTARRILAQALKRTVRAASQREQYVIERLIIAQLLTHSPFVANGHLRVIASARPRSRLNDGSPGRSISPVPYAYRCESE
jgi:hypothetical protein